MIMGHQEAVLLASARKERHELLGGHEGLSKRGRFGASHESSLGRRQPLTMFLRRP